MKAYERNHKALTTAKDSSNYINKMKRKKEFMFAQDKENILFKLKAAALNQNKIITKGEYALLNDNKTPAKDPKKAALTEKIKLASLPDGKTTDKWAENYVSNSLTKSYNMAFGVACISLIISLMIFYYSDALGKVLIKH